jgi:RNA polymerase sigma-70 factor
MMTDFLSIEELIALVRRGETDAFGDIVRRYQPEVWRVAAAMLRDGWQAEDIVQQTFVDAFFHLDQYETGRDFAAWIKEIARNRVRMELRRAQREGRRLMAYEAALLNSPDAQSHDREARMDELLRRCRERLPPQTAELVRRRYESGCSFEELARELSRSVEAIRQLLSRARLALRDCVQKQLAENP